MRLKSNQRLVVRADPRTGTRRVYLLTRLPRLTGRTEPMRAALFDPRGDDSDRAKDEIYADLQLDWHACSPDGFNDPFHEDEFCDPFYGEEELAGVMTWTLRCRFIEYQASFYICRWRE